MAPPVGEKETRYLKSIMKERPDSLLFARLADVYRKEGDIEQAIELCHNGLNAYPYYVTGRILLGRCYLEQQKTAEAIQEFTTVCSADRRNQVAIKMLADIFARQGMEQKAGDLYALLLSMDPGQPTLSQLCSRYASSGTTDLFAILDIGQPADAMASGVPPAQPTAETMVTPDATFVEQQETPFDYPAEPAVDFQENIPSAPVEAHTDETFETMDQAAPADVSGDDISDRMSTLFGEEGETLSASPTAAESPAEQPPEPALEGILNPDDDVSGTDISNRIEELFSDGAGGAPTETDSGTNGDHVAETPDMPGFQAAEGTGTVPPDEVAEDISGADISNRLGELFGEEGTSAQEASAASVESPEESGEAVTASVGSAGDTPVSDKTEEFPVAAADEVSGTDISDRLGELFGEESESTGKQTDAVTDFSGQTAEHADAGDSEDFNLASMDQTLFSDDTADTAAAVPQETSSGEQTENVVSLDEFITDETMDLEEAVPDLPQLDLSDSSSSEPEVLPLEGAEELLTGTAAADEEPERLPDKSLDEARVSFETSAEDTSAPGEGDENGSSDNQLTMAAPETDAEGPVTGEDVSDRISTVFEGTTEPSDMETERGSMEEPESVADQSDAVVTGDDISDRLEMVFDEDSDALAGSVEGTSGDGPEPVAEAAMEPEGNASDDDESYLEETMVTGSDLADRISAGIEGSTPGTAASEAEEEIMEIGGGAAEPVVTGADIADRLEMVFDEHSDPASGTQGASEADVGPEEKEKAADGEIKEVMELTDLSDDVVTGADIADRLEQVFEEPADGTGATSTSFPDEEPLEQTFVESPADNRREPDEDAAADDSLVTGSDMEERISTLFDEPEGETSEYAASTSAASAELQEEQPADTPVEFDMQSKVTGDDISDRIDMVFQEPEAVSGEPQPEENAQQETLETDIPSQMGASSASLAEAADTFFAQKYGTKKEDEEESLDQDFIEPDFEETMQFDSALFEEMLHSTGQDAPYMQDQSEMQPPADREDEVVKDDTSLSTDGRTESMPVLPAAHEGTVEAAPSQEEELLLENDDRRAEPLTDDGIAGDSPHQEEDFTFEVTTGQFSDGIADLIEEAPPVEERLDKTAVFEVNVSETQTDLVLDPDEQEPEEQSKQLDMVEPEVSVQPDGGEAGEYVEVADFFQKAVDPVEGATTPGSDGSPALGDTPVEDDTFAGVVLVDSDQNDTVGRDADVTTSDPQEGDVPEISGTDVEERLSAMFPGDDLMSLSSEELLPPEDDQEEVMDRVADFYTISGDDAGQEGVEGTVPDTISDVEFTTESPAENEAVDELVSEAAAKADSREESTRDEMEEVLPEVELFEEVTSADHTFAEETVVIDQRDKPFDIPDHVMTPTLADIYFQQGQLHLALEIYSRLTARDPDNEKLAARVEEIKQAIDATGDDTSAEEKPPAMETASVSRKTGAVSSRKKKTASPAKVDDPRPLAGVRIKKRIKKARKNSRKRS